MSITFDPALGSVTTLPVYATGNAQLRFTASFASRDAFQKAKRNGARVEMWTNLPVGASNGEWHALSFEYAEDDDNKAHLDLELPPTTADARFSFTYRLVLASGTIQWLGEYGRNGELVVEHREERFSPVEGCKLDGDRVVRVSGSSTSTTVAKLNLALDWVCWSFTRDGWSLYSPNSYATESAAVYLVPRAPEGAHRLLIHRPLLFTVEDGAHMSVSESGEVSLYKASSMTLLDTSSADLEAQLRSKLSSFSAKLLPEGFIAFLSEFKDDSSLSISVVPLSYSASSKDICLHYEDLSGYPPLGSSDVTLVNLTTYGYNSVIKADSREDITVTIEPCGAQLVLASVHTLPQIGEVFPWGLALLSPSTSIKVDSSPSAEDLAHAFPTPPPSPPPTTSTSFDSMSFHSPPTSVDSMPSILETIEKEADSSPEEHRDLAVVEEAAEETTEEVVEQPEENEKETVVVHEETSGHVVLHRSQPMRGGLLRFLFAWLLRAIVTRVFALFGRNARAWGMSWFGLESGSQTSSGAQTPSEPVDEQDEEQQVALFEEKQDSEPAEEQSVADLSMDETADENITESATDTTLATLADDNELPEKTPIAQAKALPTEPAEPMSAVLIQPTAVPAHVPSTKLRFLADVNSNTVSLLVRAPHSRLSPSALNITVDGKHVSESHDGYTCSRLSDDVYLVGVRGPDGGSRVEIALD